jgi:hypothetical protein
MFPAARRSFSLDTKKGFEQQIPVMFEALIEEESRASNYGLIMWKHNVCSRDLHNEFLWNDINLNWRSSIHLNEELSDLRLTRELISSTGYNMRGTDMADVSRVIFNHEKPCILYAACALHNAVAFLTHRDQCFFPYIFDALGLYAEIAWRFDGCECPERACRHPSYEPWPFQSVKVVPPVNVTVEHSGRLLSFSCR